MADVMPVRREEKPLLRRVAAPLDPVSRGWATVAGGSVARLALGFVASLLIARELGPAGFGVFATLGAVATVAGAVADLGLSDASVKRIASAWPGQVTSAQVRARVFFWLRVGAATLVVGAGCLVASPLAHAVLHLPHAGLLVLALLGVLATALSGAVSALLQAIGAFGRLTAVSLTNAALTALLALALALAGRLTLVTALVVLGIGTSLVAFGVGYRLLPPGWRLGWPERRVLRAEGGLLLRYGGWLWVANSCAILATQLDLLLVQRWRGAAIAGVYALAVNLAAKADLVNSSLYTVLLPAASSLAGPGTVRRYVRQSVVRSGVVALGLLVLLPLAGPLITTVYGAAYAPSADLFRPLVLIVIFDLFATPLLLLIYHIDQPKLLAAGDALRVLAVLLLGVWLIPSTGASGAIVARFGARLVGTGLILAALAWRYRRAAPVPAQKTDPS
jgi:O-antigen/teichoic acid export membrane protein